MHDVSISYTTRSVKEAVKALTKYTCDTFTVYLCIFSQFLDNLTTTLNIEGLLADTEYTITVN